jgi:hypothetical protein
MDGGDSGLRRPGYIYEAASCRLRLAETILAAGAAREDAAAALRAAADTAARLRAEPLLAAVAGLAGRARIAIGSGTVAETISGWA